MKDVLLSIKPKYAAMIYAGQKLVEFRRSLPYSAKEWRRFYIYETSPVQMVTGWAYVSYVTAATVPLIWRVFQHEGGISYKDYSRYMAGKSEAWALEISNFYRFAEPLPLSSFGIDRPPQGWRYIYH